MAASCARKAAFEGELYFPLAVSKMLCWAASAANLCGSSNHVALYTVTIHYHVAIYTILASPATHCSSPLLLNKPPTPKISLKVSSCQNRRKVLTEKLVPTKTATSRPSQSQFPIPSTAPETNARKQLPLPFFYSIPQLYARIRIMLPIHVSQPSTQFPPTGPAVPATPVPARPRCSPSPHAPRSYPAPRSCSHAGLPAPRPPLGIPYSPTARL